MWWHCAARVLPEILYPRLFFVNYGKRKNTNERLTQTFLRLTLNK